MTTDIAVVGYINIHKPVPFTGPVIHTPSQDVMLEEVKYTDSVNALEMFLKGDYIMRTEEVAFS